MEQEKYVGTTQPTEENPELTQTAASSTNKTISSVKKTLQENSGD